ncbi:MAG: M43 family zinc metalloprotease [Bacteroidota bacterium]
MDGTQRTCGSVSEMQRNLQNPILQNSYQRHLDDVDRIIANGDYRTTGVIQIPVVVHVIYRTAQQNISDAQIQSQIDILTADYRRQNADASNTPSNFLPVAADCNIEFCLASQDPNGQATDGITRTSTTTPQIGSTNQYYTAAPAWPRNDYMNIWVCELSSGLLGFAQFPGTAPAAYDGIVCSYRYFGNQGTATAPFNLGRTATHEVGHWLGLRHIWGDGPCNQDDNIGDTPASDAPNYFCPSSHTSCGSADMYQNYMDYTDDGCMNIFTAGQSAVVNATLSGTRSSLQNSQGCNGPGGGGGGGNCGFDTLGFPMTGTPALFLSGGSGAWGYVSGHNNYLDEAKANYEANGNGVTQVDGVRLQFGAAAAANASSKVVVKIWADNSGTPGATLAQQDLLIQDIINANGDVTVMFGTPATVSGAYYAGFEMTYAAGDTVGVMTDSDGDTSPATAWERWSGGTWYPYDDTNSWDLDVAHAIFPIAFVNTLTIGVTPNNPSINQGGSVALTVSGANTYTWSPSTGLSCSNCANPTASPSSTTTYTVTGVDVTGQCTTSTQVTVTVGTVGIQDDLFDGTIAAYPNPNNGVFNLEFNQAEISDLDIMIFNQLGQRIFVERLEDFSGSYLRTMQMQDIPAGIYHLQITDGTKSYRQKIVIE